MAGNRKREGGNRGRFRCARAAGLRHLYGDDTEARDAEPVAAAADAILWAGLGTIATTALGLLARLPSMTADVSPWNHWRVPAIVRDAAPGLEQGPVLVTVEYLVDPQNAKEFLRAMHRYGRVRRRDGASRWGTFRDIEYTPISTSKRFW